MRLASCLEDCPFYFIIEERIHCDGVLAEQRIFPHRQSASCRNSFSLANEINHGTSSNLVGAMTQVEGQPRFARDHVRRSGFGADPSDSGDQAWDSLSHALHCADPFRRACNRVAAKMHGCCARMVGAAAKREL